MRSEEERQENEAERAMYRARCELLDSNDREQRRFDRQQPSAVCLKGFEDSRIRLRASRCSPEAPPSAENADGL